MTISDKDDEVSIYLDVDKTRRGIIEIVDSLIYTRQDIIEINRKYRRNRILSSVKISVANGFKYLLSAMDREFEFLGVSEEFKIEVNVTADKLQEIPE